jgi:hypothetical protein
MGNIATVSSRRKLQYASVTEQLCEINTRRFGGYFQIEPEDKWGSWRISHGPNYFDLHLKPSGKGVEGKYPWPGWRWLLWCWLIFREELAVSWKGRLSDEGLSGTTAPDLARLRTFTEFQDMMSQGFPEPFKATLHKTEMSMLPIELHAYAIPSDAHEPNSEPM